MRKQTVLGMMPCCEWTMERDDGNFTKLIELARRLGAGDAAMIPAAEISAEDDLAKLCLDAPCEHYGMSAGCPPHVAGPCWFRDLLKGRSWALVFKIEVPSRLLLSEQRREVFGLLHQIAAAVEQSAVQMGYHASKGFAGGSCKDLFCRDRRECRVVAEGRPCRNPDRARPSLSGFGINVSKLMHAAGWILNRVGGPTDGTTASGTGTVCGLVLLG